MNTLNEDELFKQVYEMRVKDTINKADILQKVLSQNTLTGKCIMARSYLTPQSSDLENLYKNDLKIGKPLNNTSGDGHKNGINYEIKSSVHAKKSKLNFLQIRPDHNVDYYIFIAYNMYENDNIGKAHIFKIPSNNLYDLIVNYGGGYAHGTRDKLDNITIETSENALFKIQIQNMSEALNTKKDIDEFCKEAWKEIKEKTKEAKAANMKGRNCEYALRCNPNAKKGRNLKLWNEFI